MQNLQERHISSFFARTLAYCTTQEPIREKYTAQYSPHSLDSSLGPHPQRSVIPVAEPQQLDSEGASDAEHGPPAVHQLCFLEPLQVAGDAGKALRNTGKKKSSHSPENFADSTRRRIKPMPGKRRQTKQDRRGQYPQIPFEKVKKRILNHCLK
jgi:hypothetical protein